MARLRPWRPIRRSIFIGLMFLLLFCSVDVYLFQRTLSRRMRRDPPALLRPDDLPSVYIASINSKSPTADPKAWARAVEGVAAKIGSGRAYLSVYEHVTDIDHRDALDQLDKNLDMLSVQRSIVFAGDKAMDKFNATWTVQGLAVPVAPTRYVEQQARMRNMALRPMVDLALQGIRFDRILFLEDVVFSVRALALLPQCRD
ncbi:hypothetical protein MMC13_006034 [Lambiella insularis]|nr:hypothetical protein [Lambiella insularis]